MKILVVGQNPSPRNKAARTFYDDVSKKRLLAWLDQLGPYEYHIINASQKRGKVGLLDADPDLPFESYDAVVALGSYAAAVLTIQGCQDLLLLPHPSRLSRQLNDPEYVNRKLTEGAAWLSSQS